MLTKLISGLVLIIPLSSQAISPSLFPGFQTESLRVKVVIPVQDKPEEITLQPLLIKPTTPAPWNTIVLPSNCSGVEDKMWRFWVPELIKNNIAVVLVDSFKPRGLNSICSNQFLIGFKVRLQDVHQVLDHLRADGRFTKNKIALGGHSTGGGTAFLSSFSELQKLLDRKNDDGFNAFVGAAATCGISFKTPLVQGPLLLITGSKDDWTPPGPCEAESKRLKDAAQDATFTVIPDAYHTFSTGGAVFNPRVMKLPDGIPQMYFKQFSSEKGKTTLEFQDGEEFQPNQIIKKYGGFMGSKMFGAHGEGNWDKATDVATYTVDFLKKHGW